LLLQWICVMRELCWRSSHSFRNEFRWVGVS